MSRRQRGFTLIEMAIVMAIVGFFIVSVITATRAVQTAGGVSATNSRMDLVQKALQAYVIQHSCLPCPGDGSLASTNSNAGHALAGAATYVTTSVFCTGTACSPTTSAVVPWLDIGLSEADVTDAWNNRIRYAVGGTGCVSGTPALTATSGMRACGTATYPAGNLTLKDLENLSSGDVTTAAYVIISNGPDRAFGLAATSGQLQPDVWSQQTACCTTQNQYQNANGDSTFLRGLIDGSNDDTHFDDIVRVMTASTMIYKCGAGACGNPS